MTLFDRRTLLRMFVPAVLLPVRTQASDDPFDQLPPTVWDHPVQSGLVMIRHPEPAGITSRATIAPASEPGKRLTVSGQVFAPDGKTPAPGVIIYAYNTDAEGYYGEHRSLYPPRLYGWMRTSMPEGRFELHTIMPGHYPNMRVPAHVHFAAWGGGYPAQWIEELRFAGDEYLTPKMQADDAALKEFALIQHVSTRNDGSGYCRVKLRLRSETNFK